MHGGGPRHYSEGAFGEFRLGADPGAIGFAGARRHQATGLSYMRNRWYSPELGRFLSRDPIGFRGGLNQLAYANGSPGTARDPLGLTVTLGFDSRLFQARQLLRTFTPTRDILDLVEADKSIDVYIRIDAFNIFGNIRAQTQFYEQQPTTFAEEQMNELFTPDAQRIYGAASIAEASEDCQPAKPLFSLVTLYNAQRPLWNQYTLGGPEKGRLLTEVEWLAARLAHELWHVYRIDTLAIHDDEQQPDAFAYGFGNRFADFMGWDRSLWGPVVK